MESIIDKCGKHKDTGAKSLYRRALEKTARLCDPPFEGQFDITTNEQLNYYIAQHQIPKENIEQDSLFDEQQLKQAMIEINNAESNEQLVQIYNKYPNLHLKPVFIKALSLRKEFLKSEKANAI